MSQTDKVLAFQKCENRISKLEGRPPATVEIVDFRKSYKGSEREALGVYREKENVIGLSPELFEKGQFYESFEKLIHESRHAYQSFALNNPGFHENKEEVRVWKEGRETLVFPSPGKNDEQQAYNNNPYEKFAREYGQFFSGILKNEHQLQRARERLERELSPREKRVFSNAYSVEIFHNYPRNGLCELNISKGRTDKNPRTFSIQVPQGFHSQDLHITAQDVRQLYRKGQTRSGTIGFKKGKKNALQQQAEKLKRQSKQMIQTTHSHKHRRRN